jgi:phosphatidylglycerophosphate synthase
VATPGNAPYAPTSRRPIADLFRATAHWAVQVCVRLGIHPDVVSYGSIIASALAAACYWWAGDAPWLLIPAAGLCYVRLWLNMLDGMVALASGKASPRGEILNDLPDRISDVLIFAGVAHSGLCQLPMGYWTAIAALLTAYVGTLGQAVGTQRQFGGLMSKPWRMVALHVGSWLMLAELWRGGTGRLGMLSILDWTLLVIIAGCLQTIVVRLARIMRALSERRSS